MKILIILIFLFFTHAIIAEEYSSLYGFSLGDPINKVLEKFGEPDKIIELKDKSEVNVFIKEDHYAVFVTLPPKNDSIFSIQLTGQNSSKEQGIEGVRLGDAFEKVLKMFGEPTRSRAAIDQETRKEVEDTNIHFYGENFSFEVANGKVTSIKLTYDKTLSSDNPADEKLMARQPVELQKVRDHILKNDYPELFGDKSYRIAIDSFKIIDFGNDGIKEVVVLYRPHYLQSPTIVIYQILKDGTVKRVREALAPGPLVKRGDYFLDSHSLGQAVDFTAGNKPLPIEDGRKMAVTASDKSGFGLVVHYSDFFHADSRSGESTYIDMAHVEKFTHSKNCSEFEFSRVDAISVGTHKKDKNVGFIAAIVGKQIYLYEIRAIMPDGFLDKRLTIVNRK